MERDWSQSNQKQHQFRHGSQSLFGSLGPAPPAEDDEEDGVEEVTKEFETSALETDEEEDVDPVDDDEEKEYNHDSNDDD